MQQTPTVPARLSSRSEVEVAAANYQKGGEEDKIKEVTETVSGRRGVTGGFSAAFIHRWKGYVYEYSRLIVIAVVGAVPRLSTKNNILLMIISIELIHFFISRLMFISYPLACWSPEKS